ncbi:MAG: hypothetical protein FJ146_04150 [Deltaproteobacteria bacterium]|nr:hypothetical protein [Deltaproteobacteria bacterium]
MTHDRLSKTLQLCCLLLASLAAATLAARQIDLSTADLGRHLANGRWVLEDRDVLYSNFYSYTHPQAPFVNHHWLSGVIFYGVHALTDFVGLSLFYCLLVGGATAVISFSAWRDMRSWVVVAATLIALPMISYRTEVRPEGISLLLSAITYGMINGYSRGRLKAIWLPALLPLMVLWVNCHIYFFFGLLIIGAFTAQALLHLYFIVEPVERSAALLKFKLLALLLLTSCMVTVINPEGWNLATYPFRIFNNYGYMIVENQGIPFFIRRGMHFPVFGPVYVALLVMFVLTLRVAIKCARRLPFATTALCALLALMALSAIRNIAMFGLFFVPTACQTLAEIKSSRWRNGLMVLATLMATFSFILPTGSQFLSEIGIGLKPGALDAANFYGAQRLKGPLFNNYDIGGYLIYSLFPDTKVFVDNRPEAYPARFLTEAYVPAQEDNTKWQELDAALHFNVIFFNWHDYTPAGQTFLIHRINDPEWAPIYVDPYALILVRRTTENQDVISRFEIPRDRFSVKS